MVPSGYDKELSTSHRCKTAGRRAECRKHWNFGWHEDQDAVVHTLKVEDLARPEWWIWPETAQ